MEAVLNLGSIACSVQKGNKLKWSRTTRIKSSTAVGVSGRRAAPPRFKQSATSTSSKNRPNMEVKYGSKKRESEGALEELERLEEAVLEDDGRSPEDYQRRARIFEELARRVSE